jgi:hypothetical protein
MARGLLHGIVAVTASAHSPVPPPLTVVPPPPLPPAPDDSGFSPLPPPRPPLTELGRALPSSLHDGRQLAHSTAIVGSGSIVGSVASATLLAYAISVALSGSYAYVAAANSDALVVIDVSNPASPVIRGSVVSSSFLLYVRVALSFVHHACPRGASAADVRALSLARPHVLCTHRVMPSL